MDTCPCCNRECNDIITIMAVHRIGSLEFHMPDYEISLACHMQMLGLED